MTLLGVHLANRRLESGELDRIRKVGCSAYVVYVPFLGDSAYWLGVCKSIRTAQPSAQIHLRLEKRGGLGNPADEANQAASLVNPFAGYVNSWTWRNEPNNADAGEAPSTLTASAWGTWLTTFLANARLLALPPVAAPPMSPGARDAAGFIAATANAAHTAGVKKKHIHFYGAPDVAASDMDRQRQFDDEELIGTEYNFGAGNVYDLNRYVTEIPEVCRRAAIRRIKTVGVFIWQWFTPPSIPTTVNIRDTAVEPGMTAMQKDYPETAPPPGGPMFTITHDQLIALLKDTYAIAGIPWNPNSGFTKFVIAEAEQGRYVGAPETNEFPFEQTGLLIQKFATTWLWAKNTDFVVHKGFPPLA